MTGSEGGVREAASHYEVMMQMITGFWVSQVVRSAADLSLAEHLENGPRTAEEVSRAENADPDSTFRLLRVCAGLGLVTRDGDAFRGTSLLALLHSDNPASLKSFALVQTSPGHWLTWGRAIESVRKGDSQAEQALGQPLFDYYVSNPEEGALFSRAMTGLSTPVIKAAAGLIDLTGVGSVVDVGGAEGAFVLELMQRNPAVHGSVLDLAHAIPGAEAAAKARGLQHRFTGVAGDFFDQVPPADLYLLKYILHDWDDDASVRILRRCREALRPGGRIVVVDIVMPDDPGESFAPLMDMAMLTMLGSRERTIAELDGLFSQAGLRRTAVKAVLEPYHAIEAVAA